MVEVEGAMSLLSLWDRLDRYKPRIQRAMHHMQLVSGQYRQAGTQVWSNSQGTKGIYIYDRQT